MAETVLALGMMSGTSADGVDAALVETDGIAASPVGVGLTVPYEDRLRRALRAFAGTPDAPGGDVERAMTETHAEAARRLLAEAGVAPAAVRVIGFHGHTVFHAPERRLTRQIGDGALLARLTGIDVVCDFRSADVAAGGNGAPLAPLFHAAMAEGLERPLAVLNLGGVGNVTWLGTRDSGGSGRAVTADFDILAFDTGPGNALIDDWAERHTGRPVDRDGRLAASGTVDEAALAALMADPFFARRPPKSLDRDHFAARARQALDGLSAADGAATLVAFTAAAVAAGRAHFPAPARSWLVCGGGRRNPVMMAALADRLDAPVAAVDSVAWDGDALEAQAFAFLAVRSLYGLPLSLPSTTGVPAPATGGVLYRARA